MSNLAMNTRATVIPTISYRNALAAMEWLCRVFGFEKQLVVAEDDGTIAHAQLTFGNGMIMVSSTPEVKNEFMRLVKEPGEIGGMVTQTIVLVVSDADILYERAKTAGAEIILEIRDQHYGGRGFSCRDLEGHIWNFGTYDPWTPG